MRRQHPPYNLITQYRLVTFILPAVILSPLEGSILGFLIDVKYDLEKLVFYTYFIHKLYGISAFPVRLSGNL